jgi:hypothetical protein
VEARLTDTLSRPRIFEGLPIEMLQDGLAARIDRYLRATGALDAATRSRLGVATARDLWERNLGDEVSWAEIVAAVDRSLAAEFALDGISAETLGARGRVALGLASDHVAAETGAATPPRIHRQMHPQELSPWRPSFAWRRLRLSRPTQGLAASLCWLAILTIP